MRALAVVLLFTSSILSFYLIYAMDVAIYSYPSRTIPVIILATHRPSWVDSNTLTD